MIICIYPVIFLLSPWIYRRWNLAHSALLGVNKSGARLKYIVIGPVTSVIKWFDTSEVGCYDLFKLFHLTASVERRLMRYGFEGGRIGYFWILFLELRPSECLCASVSYRKIGRSLKRKWCRYLVWLEHSFDKLSLIANGSQYVVLPILSLSSNVYGQLFEICFFLNF